MNLKSHTIYLDGKVDSSLDFHLKREACLKSIEMGEKLHFKIDLGLFKSLKKPLSNESQLLSLKLSLKHFKETLFEEFHDSIESVSILDITIDLIRKFSFDEELQKRYEDWLVEHQIKKGPLTEDEWYRFHFIKNLIARYLYLLIENLGGDIPFQIDIDLKDQEHTIFSILMTSKDLFEPFFLNIQNQSSFIQEKASLAVLLPEKESVEISRYENLKHVIHTLNEYKIPHRYIPETMLITEWHLLDYLIVDSSELNSKIERMLKGFKAADGKVVFLQNSTIQDDEITFSDFIVDYFPKINTMK